MKALRKLAGKLGVSADYLETGSELDPAAARELRLSDLELAIRLGDSDGSDEAVRVLLADAIAAADGPCAFRARIALATVLEARDDQLGAITLIEAAIVDEPFQPAERPDVYARLAHAYGAAGRPADAVQLLERCLEGSADAPAAEARYAALLSYALTDLGEIARAEEVVRTALERMRDTEDPYMRVRLYWSLARLAEAEGRGFVALSNVRKAIALLESTEDALNLARAHILAGRILLSRENAAAATEHLDHAERLLGMAPAAQDLIEVKVQRSRIAILQADADKAVVLARDALAIDSHPADRGEALAALAEGLTLRGELEPAESAFRESVEILESHSRWRAAANTCRAWSQMLRHSGREADALDVLDRAAELGMRATPQHTRTER